MQYKMKDLSTESQIMLGMIIQSYIDVCGMESWLALSTKEQHDFIMKVVKDLYQIYD